MQAELEQIFEVLSDIALHLDRGLPSNQEGWRVILHENIPDSKYWLKVATIGKPMTFTGKPFVLHWRLESSYNHENFQYGLTNSHGFELVASESQATLRAAQIYREKAQEIESGKRDESDWVIAELSVTDPETFRLNEMADKAESRIEVLKMVLSDLILGLIDADWNQGGRHFLKVRIKREKVRPLEQLLKTFVTPVWGNVRLVILEAE